MQMLQSADRNSHSDTFTAETHSWTVLTYLLMALVIIIVILVPWVFPHIQTVMTTEHIDGNC